MDNGLVIFGALLACCAIWLAVRIVNRREPRAIWTAAALLTSIVVYTLSFGPACWLASCRVVRIEAIRDAYWPLVRIAFSSRKTPLASYAELFSGNPNIVNDLYFEPPAPGESVIRVYPVIVRHQSENPNISPGSK